MEFGSRIGLALLGLCLGVAPTAASAQNVVKLGMVGEFSGPFAQYGQQILGGMKAYMKVSGDTVAGKKIEIIQKDTTGPSPDVAKRLAQELVTRDNVDILVGFGLTPNALAVAPVATEAKKLMVIMNAATSIITTKSPYIVRVSMTLPQVTQPMAIWAAKNGIKKVYTVVADYGPGLDAEKEFTAAFKNAGGEIGGSIHTPLQNPDLAVIYEALKKTGGSTDADKLIAVMKGMKIASPRGPIMIDPETRDVVQTVYIRKVEKVGGRLYNVEFDKFPDQKDPGK